jgi:paraquat-inducible protein A
LGCPECDQLFQLRRLAPGETALCPRCAYVVTQNVRDGFYRPLIYAATALLSLVIALSFPFLSLQAAGLQNSMTLPQVITSLAFFHEDIVAFLVMCFVFIIPGLMLLAIIMLCQAMLLKQLFFWVIPVTRFLFQLNAWSMVEVFAIGVIVSLVKIAGMAKVTLGLSFWGYLAFALFFLLAMKNFDRLMVWTTIEELGSRH